LYTERLWVPVGWWVLTALFALSLLIAVLFYLGPVWGFGSGLLVMVVMGGAFLRYGREEIRVEPDRLWVGGANIEWEYVAEVRVLDEHATRRRRGPDSDARAYLVLRPYLNRAVEVTIADRTDPTPYWLISSRHPQRLAAAIAAQFGTEEISSATDAGADAGADAVVRPQVSPPRDTVES
jgi:hypothetical protein